jgi:hypothetical protein
MDWFKGVVGAGAGAALFRGLLLHRRVRADGGHGHWDRTEHGTTSHHEKTLAITVKTKHRGGQK